MDVPRTATRTPRIAAVLASAAVAVLAVAVYANSLSNGFVWDDPIILDRQLVVFDSASAVLLPPRGIPQYSPDYYRPLTIASYLLDRTLGRRFAAGFGAGEAFAFHLSVVLAHAAACALLVMLGLRLLGHDRSSLAGAFGAGALFAVHPVHTESVAWMAGRADVLATCFCLATLLVHRGRATTWARSAASGLLAALALGAKEVGAAAIALLPLQDWLFPAREREEGTAGFVPWARAYAGPAAAAIAYFALRRASIGGLVGGARGEEGMIASLDRVLGALGAYLCKLVWPIDLNAYIDVVPTSTTALALSTAAVLAVAAAVTASLRSRDRVPAFCSIWVVLTLAPSLSIVWKIPDAPMAERYLYLPSVGFCLLLGWALREAWRRSPPMGRWATLGVLAILVAAGALHTARRNRVWHDDLSLWRDTSRKALDSGMPLRSLATAYQKRGEPEQARRWFERALERRNNASGRVIILNNLGTLAMSAGDFASAEERYRQALAFAESADAAFNLALAILEKGKWNADAISAAMPYLAMAHHGSPYDPDVHAVLGRVQAIQGDRDRAIANLERSLDLGLNPVSAEGVKRLLRRLRSEERSGEPSTN